jgi:hypothetical protein
MELPKEKRPPEIMIWWGTPEEIEGWIERVFNSKNKGSGKEEIDFVIPYEDVE